jgi:excisionase family DNA binding protein
MAVANEERLGYRVQEAADAIGCSLRTMWDLIAKGEVQTYTIGRARYVDPQSLREFVAKRIEESR